jgi:branched-chain amino acid transport system substrate-binding protein
MVKKAMLLTVSAVIVLGLLIGGFGFESASAKEPLKIGCIYPMTGPMTGYGVPGKAAMEYMCEKINREGGILGRQVVPVFRDSELNPEKTVRHARDLVENEGVMFLGGCVSSGASLAASQYVLSLKGKALWTAYPSTAAAITEVKGGRYTSRVSHGSLAWSSATAWASARKWGKIARRIYTLNPDYAYGHECAKAMKAVWNKLVPGSEIVGQAWPPLGCKDFTSYIMPILAKKPDILQSALYGGDALIFLKQASAHGLLDKVQLVGQDLGIMPTLMTIRRGDPAAPIGAMGATNYPFYLPKFQANAESVAYYKHVYDKTGWYFDCLGVSVYPYIMFLKTAMEKANTTTDLEKIIDALEDLTIDFFGTPLHFRACDHQVLFPVWTGIVGWDRENRFPCPILVDDVQMVNFDEVYNSCEKVKAVREAAGNTYWYK